MITPTTLTTKREVYTCKCCPTGRQTCQCCPYGIQLFTAPNIHIYHLKYQIHTHIIPHYNYVKWSSLGFIVLRCFLGPTFLLVLSWPSNCALCSLPMLCNGFRSHKLSSPFVSQCCAVVISHCLPFPL